MKPQMLTTAKPPKSPATTEASSIHTLVSGTQTKASGATSGKPTHQRTSPGSDTGKCQILKKKEREVANVFCNVHYVLLAETSDSKDTTRGQTSSQTGSSTVTPAGGKRESTTAEYKPHPTQSKPVPSV